MGKGILSFGFPPLFLQNAPIPLEKNALEIIIPHRYCLLFHTASHRAAA